MPPDLAHDGGAERAAAKSAELEMVAHVLGHDLRAPARHVHGLVRAMGEVLGDRMSPEARELLGMAESSAERISTMIEAMVEWLRCGGDPVRATQLDLNVLVADALAIALRGRPGRADDLLIGTLPMCVADRAGIVRALVELLDNALAAGEPAGAWAGSREVVVTGEIVESPTGPRARLSVRDRGMGFDPAAAAQLFRPFSTLHPRRGAERFPGRGLGMGLAMATRIVQSNGGSIDGVSAGSGQGATFRITLPSERPSVGVARHP